METTPEVHVPGQLLGKKPPKFDPRTVRAATLLTKPVAKLPSPPGYHNLSRVTQRAFPVLGEFKNRQHNCCTISAQSHGHQIWSAHGKRPWQPTDQDVLVAYNAINGGVDQGAFMLDALNHSRNVGIGGNKIFAYARINPTNEDEMKLFHYLFGGLYVGAMLPVSAQHQKVWDWKEGEVGSEPGSWGGHAMYVMNYTKHGVTFVTWGALQQATWAWWLRYVDECFCIIEEDYVGEDRRTPQGFSMKRLEAYLKTL